MLKIVKIKTTFNWVLNPYENDEKLKKLVEKNVFHLNFAKNNKAQSMDILSSQANLAGYKAVITHCIYQSYTNDDDSSRNNTNSKSACCWRRGCWSQAMAGQRMEHSLRKLMLIGIKNELKVWEANCNS